MFLECCSKICRSVVLVFVGGQCQESRLRSRGGDDFPASLARSLCYGCTVNFDKLEVDVPGKLGHSRVLNSQAYLGDLVSAKLHLCLFRTTRRRTVQL